MNIMRTRIDSNRIEGVKREVFRDACTHKFLPERRAAVRKKKNKNSI